MRRVNVTSGGGGKRSKSKFKITKYERVIKGDVFYFDVSGELDLSQAAPLLIERDLKTNKLTGDKFILPRKGTFAILPGKYREQPKLEIVCRIKDIRFKERQGQIRHRYTITSFYYIQIPGQNQTTSSNRNKIIAVKPNPEKKASIKPAQPPKPQNIVRYVGTKEEIEKYVSNELQKVLGGEREVLTPDGDRIDLLTKAMLIEVKAASDWDNAIGQILKYKIHYPNHQAVIFLFDNGFNANRAKNRLTQIIQTFLSVDIKVVTAISDLK